jgi:hypothetical protein
LNPNAGIKLAIKEDHRYINQLGILGGSKHVENFSKEPILGLAEDLAVVGNDMSKEIVKSVENINQIKDSVNTSLQESDQKSQTK